MSKIERMTIAISEPMAAEIRAAVDAGDYVTTSEVVREGMRLWSERRARREQDIERIRQAWDEGKASGPGRPFDMNALLKEWKAEREARDD